MSTRQLVAFYLWPADQPELCGYSIQAITTEVQFIIMGIPNHTQNKWKFSPNDVITKQKTIQRMQYKNK